MPIGLAEYYALALLFAFIVGMFIGVALGKGIADEERDRHSERLQVKQVNKHMKGD